MPTCSSKVSVTWLGACCRRAPSAGELCTRVACAEAGPARISAPPNSAASRARNFTRRPAACARCPAGCRCRSATAAGPARPGRWRAAGTSPTSAATWVSSRSTGTSPAAMSCTDSATSTTMNVPSSGTSPAARRGTSAAARNATPIAMFQAAPSCAVCSDIAMPRPVPARPGIASASCTAPTTASATPQHRAAPQHPAGGQHDVGGDRVGQVRHVGGREPRLAGQPGGLGLPSGTIGAGREVCVEGRDGHADRLAVEARGGSLAEPITSHIWISRPKWLIGSRVEVI